jgi:hypothetical protein
MFTGASNVIRYAESDASFHVPVNASSANGFMQPESTRRGEMVPRRMRRGRSLRIPPPLL